MRSRLTAPWALVFVLLSGCRSGQPTIYSTPVSRPIGDTLTLTVVPYEAADKLSEEYADMATYLAQKLHRRTGRFTAVVDYAGVLAALQSGQIDVAYLSPFPYALATSRMKLHGLGMPWVFGSLTYRGIIFCRADSSITRLADLRGKTFAFGDVTSTTGYLLPRALLEAQGRFADLRWRNAGNANMVVKAVENRTAHAGAAYESVFEVVYKSEPQRARSMRVIAQTEPIPNGIYVARPDMPGPEVAALRAAFLAMNTDPVGRPAMLKAPNDRIVAADDSLFDTVRRTARILKLDLTSLENKKR